MTNNLETFIPSKIFNQSLGVEKLQNLLLYVFALWSYTSDCSWMYNVLKKEIEYWRLIQFGNNAMIQIV